MTRIWHIASIVLALALASACGGVSPPQPAPQPVVVASAPAPAASASSAPGEYDPPLEPAPKMTDPEAPGLAFERWTKPADSSYRPLERIEPRCWKDVGCPFEPAAIAPCPMPIDALTVAEAQRVAERPHLVAPKLFVKAIFAASRTMTMLECGQPASCCNRGGGSFALSDSVAAMNERNVMFLSSRNRGAFSCGGDDSTTCCGFQSADVIAFGRVRGQTMSEPLLCKP